MKTARLCPLLACLSMILSVCPAMGQRPAAVLARGYALVQREADGSLVRAAEQAPAGTRVRVQVRAGELRCRVEESIAGDGAGAGSPAKEGGT